MEAHPAMARFAAEAGTRSGSSLRSAGEMRLQLDAAPCGRVAPLDDDGASVVWLERYLT